jgi:hypothetical protein
MPERPHDAPNPKRVEVGRRNRAKRKGLTPEGREKLRQSALKHRPWRYATGPRTPEGKAKAALNARRRQVGDLSVRELQRQLANVNRLFDGLVAVRQMVAEAE